jgi:protein-S-isoprenylcysteine O-methyltransferase Ste14
MNASPLWHALFWTWTASEVLILLVTRTHRRSGTVRDRGSIVVLWIVIFSSIFAGSWYSGTHPHTISAGAHWVRTASVAMLVAGLAVRWTAIASLGRSFSANVAIHANQKLYRKGLFALVRHPSYTGMVIIFAAIGLHMRNWAGLAIVLIPTTAALLYRIHVEEAALPLGRSTTSTANPPNASSPASTDVRFASGNGSICICFEGDGLVAQGFSLGSQVRNDSKVNGALEGC